MCVLATDAVRLHHLRRGVHRSISIPLNCSGYDGQHYYGGAHTPPALAKYTGRRARQRVGTRRYRPTRG